MCQEFHCLPEVGGILDQDPMFIYFTEVVLEAKVTRQELEEARRKVSGGNHGT